MIYLSLGANLGDREASLTQAIELIQEAGIAVLRQSSRYETAPQDVLDQPWFLNMVIECQTTYSPLQLIRKLLSIEKKLGRDRSASAIRRGPRLIDIDILLYGQTVIQTPRLSVPHPRMLERRFVLDPLLELAPNLKDPRTNQSIAKALAQVQTQLIKKR